MDAITDPQTQSSYEQADPNANAVESSPVGGQEDNQRVLARQTPSGTSRGVQQLGGPSLQADSGNKQITVTDTVPEVLMGSQPTFGEGFYVSKSGIDATTTTNPDDFIFNSNQNVFKIVQTGTATMPIASYNTTTKTVGFANASSQIAHNLSYTPICLGFIISLGGTLGSQLLPATVITGGSGVRTLTENYQVSADNIYVYLTSTISYVSNSAESRNDASTNYVIKYYLLQETAN